MTHIYSEFWNRFFHNLAKIIIRFRWLIIVLVALLTTFFAFQMQNLSIDSSNENIFMKDAPAMVLNQKFKDIFGNEDFAYIIVCIGSQPSQETLHLFNQLANDLEKKVPYLKDLIWLGNVEEIHGKGDVIEVRKFLDPFPKNTEEIKRALNKAIDDPLYINNLISEDKETLGLVLEFETYPEDKVNPRQEIAPAIRKILAKPKYMNLTMHLAGTPIIDYDLDAITISESRFFMGFVLFVQAIFLWWLARGFSGVFVPLTVVSISIIWTFGMIAILGFPLNLFAIMVPTLLACVGIGDSMHVIAEFQDHIDHDMKRHEALIKSVSTAGLPCLLTSLTTAAGFLSFTVIDSKVFRELGIYTAIGCIFAFLLTIVLVPILYSFGGKTLKKTVPDKGKHRQDVFDRLLSKIHQLVTNQTYVFIFIFVILTIVSFIGYQRLEVESDTKRMLSTRIPIRQAIDYIDKHMGGSQSVEIMIDTGKEDGIKNPAFLKQLDKLQQFVDDHSMTVKTISILSILKKMRQVFHNDDKAYYTIPNSQEETSDYIELYEISGGEELYKFAGPYFDIARLSVRTKSMDSKSLHNFMKDLEKFLLQSFPSDVKVELSGVLREFADLGDILTSGQRKSFIAAFIVISLIMIIVLRSIWLGLISMIPNVFPVLITLGLMGYAGIYLDFALISFSAVIIGVAVDDTIHFFTRYRKEFNLLGNYSQALEKTLATVGRPITFTTMTLVVGFSVMAPSAMLGIVRFALLAGFAFTWALLADFFFAPALILIFKPLGPERQPEKNSDHSN